MNIYIKKQKQASKQSKSINHTFGFNIVSIPAYPQRVKTTPARNQIYLTDLDLFAPRFVIFTMIIKTILIIIITT